jgi:hypothetical protein
VYAFHSVFLPCHCEERSDAATERSDIGHPSSRFDKLKGPEPVEGLDRHPPSPRLRRGRLPSFLGLQMNSSYVIANLRNEGEAIHLTF